MARNEILVYSDNGEGASDMCVAMTISSIKQVLKELQPTYLVRTTEKDELVGSKWSVSCRLLVMPGGRDLPYCRELNGAGNTSIRAFVEQGGSYLGICAGAYYGSAYVEFAKGNSTMEVLGLRQLAFFPMTSVGPVFPGFSYDSNCGAHMAGVNITLAGQDAFGSDCAGGGEAGVNVTLAGQDAFGSDCAGGGDETTSLYCNGGCYFLPREVEEDSTPLAETCNTLATYTGYTEISQPPNHAPQASGRPAIIGGVVGKGRVILSGLHFEVSPEVLAAAYEGDEYLVSLLPFLREVEDQRRRIFSGAIKYLLSRTLHE